MEIYTCDSCGARVTARQLERGEAVESEGYVYCARCARELGHETEGQYAYEDETEDQPIEQPPPRGLNVKLLASVTVAAIVLGAAVGLFLMKGDEGPARRAAPPVRKPPPRRRQVLPRPAVKPAAPVEPEAPAEKAVPAPARAAEEPVPEESLLAAGFEKEGYAFQCAYATRAERLKEGAARGDGVLRALKQRMATAPADASVRVTLPAPVDLSGYNKLGFWLRSSGVENELKLALITGGRQGFIIPSRDPIFSGEWRWFQFLLAGERNSVEGLVLYFNQRAEPSAYYVYLDEVRAYEKAGAVISVAPTRPVAPTPEAGKILADARPRGTESLRHDFDGAKPADWREGELFTPGKGGAGGCLKSVVHGDGDARYKRVYFAFRPELKMESGTAISFAYKLDKCRGISIQCWDITKDQNVRAKFAPLTPGEWGRITIKAADLVSREGDVHCEPGDLLNNIGIFAGGEDTDRELCIDDFVVAAEAPGPEEPAAAAAVAQDAEPAARMDVTAGGEVVLAQDFEDGAGPFTGGKITSSDTYRSSRASFKADVKLEDEFYPCRIQIDKWSVGKRNEKGILPIQDETVIAFAYYVDGGDSLTLMSWFEDKKVNLQSRFEKVPQKTWTLAQVRYMDFKSNDSQSKAKLEKGDAPQNLSWLAGKKGTQCTLIVDDVVICNGRIPGDIGKTLKRKFDKKRETQADPRKDGYYMTMEMIDKLAERLKGSDVKRKTLAILGDKLAASNYFLAPLAKEGKRFDFKEGYKFIPKAALAQATRRLSSYRKREALKKALQRYRPEVVAVLAGYNDLKRGLPADDVQTEYSYVCECCIEAGAVPVLITVPLGADARTQAGGLALGYTGAAFKTAKTVGVPMIDTHSWLNAEGKSHRTFFTTTGLKQPAYDQLNALFVEVYDRLERYVLQRGE